MHSLTLKSPASLFAQTTYNKSRPGFTLVELLVVIGIVAVLASILLPVVGRAKRAANETRCAAQIRQFTMGMTSYAQANRGRLPILNGPGTVEGWLRLLTADLGFESIQNSSKLNDRLEELLSCPETAANQGLSTNPVLPPLGGGLQIPNSGPEFWFGAALTQWRDQRGPSGRPVQGSYGANGWLMPHGPSNLPAQNFYTSFSSLPRPSEVPAFADANWFIGWPLESELPPANLSAGGQTMGQDSMGRFCIDRHRKAINVGFCDGSVRRVPLGELWQLRWHRNWGSRTVEVP